MARNDIHFLQPYIYFFLPQPEQEQQSPQQLSFRRSVRTAAHTSSAAKAMISTISQIFITIPLHRQSSACTRNAASQATAHCHTTTPTAHLAPISRLMEAIAATQGV